MKGEGLSGRPFFSQALRLRNFRPSAAIAAWKPPESGGSTGGSDTGVVYHGRLGGLNQHAVGGFVQSDGLVRVHAGNMITPARTTRGVKGFSELMTMARNANHANDESMPNHLIDARNVGGQTSATTVHYSPTVNINGAKPGAEKRFREELNEHTAHITRIFTREIDRSRARG